MAPDQWPTHCSELLVPLNSPSSPSLCLLLHLPGIFPCALIHLLKVAISEIPSRALSPICLSFPGIFSVWVASMPWLCPEASPESSSVLHPPAGHPESSWLMHIQPWGWGEGGEQEGRICHHQGSTPEHLLSPPTASLPRPLTSDFHQGSQASSSVLPFWYHL